MVLSTKYTYTHITSQGKGLILFFAKGVSDQKDLFFAEVKDLFKYYIFNLMACANASFQALVHI